MLPLQWFTVIRIVNLYFLHTLGYNTGLNKSGIVFCEACGVRPVDEQYPAPPWFLSTLELHGLFFFQHHSVIEVLTPVLHYCSWTFIRHTLSDRLTKVGRNDFWRSGSRNFRVPLWSAFNIFRTLSKNRRALTNGTIEATAGINRVTCTVLQCHSSVPLPSPYLSWLSYQAKVAPVLTLWARFPALPSAWSSPPLFAVLYWCGGIDQLICWLCGQGLSVLMPAWQMGSLLTTAATQLPFERVANKRDCIPEFIRLAAWT